MSKRKAKVSQKQFVCASGEWFGGKFERCGKPAEYKNETSIYACKEHAEAMSYNPMAEKFLPLTKPTK